MRLFPAISLLDIFLVSSMAFLQSVSTVSIVVEGLPLLKVESLSSIEERLVFKLSRERYKGFNPMKKLA